MGDMLRAALEVLGLSSKEVSDLLELKDCWFFDFATSFEDRLCFKTFFSSNFDELDLVRSELPINGLGLDETLGFSSTEVSDLL